MKLFKRVHVTDVLVFLADRLPWFERNFHPSLHLRQHLKNHALQLAFIVANHLPWFARKRALNLLVGREHFTDFIHADQILDGRFGLMHGWTTAVKN
jgi:hypothetical protein